MNEILYEYTSFQESHYASIQLITNSSPIEAVITCNGFRFHIIYGKYQNGYYLVIPTLQIGCDMSYYNDTFWNKESLLRTGLSVQETEIIVEGIKYLWKSVK